MNRICVVNYGANEKCRFSVSDFENLRVVNCRLRHLKLSFLLRARIKKHTRGYLCLDKFCIAENTVCPEEKGLFIRDIGLCVKKYCEIYGVDSKSNEIAVYGSVSPELVKYFSECFSMVWLYGSPAGEYPNTFTVTTRMKIKTYFSVYADGSFDVPDSEVIFNLTDIKIRSVNNIEICSEGLPDMSSLYLREAVRISGTPYEIISFIK